jgi:hypothetical protein
MNLSDSGDPSSVEVFALCASSLSNGPIAGFLPLATLAIPLSTRNSAKKTGDCSSIGRQEEKGLVPVSRYRAMVSCVMACRDTASVLPLYFSWIFLISGWISCSPRDALICFTNSGMSRIRITITRPTIDNAHVQPDDSGNPIAEKTL